MTDQPQPSETVGRPWRDTLETLVHIAEASDWDVANAEPHEHEIMSKRSDYAYLDIVKFCQREMPVLFERDNDHSGASKA